jgi:hypothetical protein
MAMSHAPEKKSPVITIAAIVGLLLILLGVYIAGYLFLSESISTTLRVNGVVTFEGTVRSFPNGWLARAYTPAAIVEETITRTPVATGYQAGGMSVILNR